MSILNCAANGVAEMELGRETNRHKCTGHTVKYWYQNICLDTEDLAKKCYEWKKSDTSVRSWTKELKDELYNIELAFAYRKKHGCDLRELTKIVKDRCTDTER